MIGSILNCIEMKMNHKNVCSSSKTVLKRKIYNTKNFIRRDRSRTSLVVQWVRLRAPNAGGLGSIPGRGTRSRMQQLKSYMPQLRVHMPQLRSLRAATKDLARVKNK